MKRIIVANHLYSSKLSNIYCSSLNPNSCINEKSTGVSYYDNFLDDEQLQYLQRNKNLTGYIEYMTPSQYYKECAKLFNSSVNSLKLQRQSDTESIDWLTNALESKRKFQLPYINYANGGQEGLHRMMVLGDEFGWDSQTFPVLVVEYLDEQREIIDEAYRKLRKAVNESVEYRYNIINLPNYFIDQIQYELDNGIDEDTYTVILKHESNDKYVITLDEFKSDIEITVYKNDMRIYEDEDDSDDIDSFIDNLDNDIS